MSSTSQDDASNSLGRGIRVLVFPDSNDGPPGLTKSAVRIPVSPAILEDLLAPELGVGLRPGSVLGTTVPETAIHEDCDPKTRKYDVGGPPNARYWADVDAVSEAQSEYGRA